MSWGNDAIRFFGHVEQSTDPRHLIVNVDYLMERKNVREMDSDTRQKVEKIIFIVKTLKRPIGVSRF